MNEEDWLRRLRQLNPAHGRGSRSGKAPHKPLLLLSLLDALEAEELDSPLFTITPSLFVRFQNYSAITSDRWPGKLKIKMPFFFLSSQGFWSSFDQFMNPAVEGNAFANEIDKEFYALCHIAGFRLKARCVLISEYFTKKEQVALFTAVGLGYRMALEIREEMPEDIFAREERQGRSATFRSNVVIQYRLTCALTGYRCDTVTGASIVDAAHIVAFSEAGNDELHNGLALSKNAHWMFDEGLWGISDDLRILVPEGRFSEEGPDAFLLRNFKGKMLQINPKATLRPSLDCIRKHRDKHGIAS